MNKIKRIIGVIVFALIFAVGFILCDNVLCRKELSGWWNVTAKIDGFYNSPEEEYDVIYFGSSNTYCSFNPLVIWERTGVKSYVFATQQQPVWATYHYMVDAFKRQKPDVAVMDVLMFSKNDEYYDDGVNYTFCDNMPLSRNKVEMAMVSAPKGKRFGLLCRFVKYHSRWSDLSEQDFTYKRSDMTDYSKGFYVLDEVCPDVVYTDTSEEMGRTELNRKNLEYLYKIIDLCRKSNVQLMLVKAPSNSTVEEKRYYNAVKEIADKEGVLFADYNLKYDEIGLDLKRDFFDGTHLNVWGAEKFSEYFAKTTEYFVGKSRSDEDWRTDYEKYLEVWEK
ncbi:MAG: hypothetical protein PUE13_04695 [Clostridiales bacterium]|nr:hypothetical protein [Clostridiales bacterium]